MGKRGITALLFAGLLFFLVQPVLAAGVTLHLFWSLGCPHCAKERVFLNTLREKYPQLTIKEYEITSNRNNAVLLERVGRELQADVSGVPFTVIGKEYVVGYLNDETTGKAIEDIVKTAVASGSDDIVGGLLPKDPTPKLPEQRARVPETLDVPVFGALRVKSLSLPVVTFVIALLDGFNPCAMWTLLFLISLLVGLKDKKRMWILGTAFIATSAMVYFLFLSAWLNLFLFLGFVMWIRILVGLVALVAGGWYVRDYWVNKTGSCPVTGNEKRQKVFEALRATAKRREFLFALGGIVLLAIAVNMVELVCSAGLPAIYTQILSLSRLPPWQYYLYLMFYIIVFMLDDLFVFFAAMITLKVTGVQSKYARYSHLVGGVLMLIIGVLLLVKPELLMFG